MENKNHFHNLQKTTQAADRNLVLRKVIKHYISPGKQKNYRLTKINIKM